LAASRRTLFFMDEFSVFKTVVGGAELLTLSWVRRSESRPVRRSESDPLEGGLFYVLLT
jgi:hypothetical protein